MITDSISREITDDINWNQEKTQRGCAGNQNILLVGTEADLNDHWVDVFKVQAIPDFSEYQRVISLYFSNKTGKVIVSSVIDDEPSFEADLDQGDYTIYVAGNNLGVDQLSLGEENELSDAEIRERKDIERYSIFIMLGKPSMEGKIKDVA